MDDPDLDFVHADEDAVDPALERQLLAEESRRLEAFADWDEEDDESDDEDQLLIDLEKQTRTASASENTGMFLHMYSIVPLQNSDTS